VRIRAEAIWSVDHFLARQAQPKCHYANSFHNDALLSRVASFEATLKATEGRAERICRDEIRWPILVGIPILLAPLNGRGSPHFPSGVATEGLARLTPRNEHDSVRRSHVWALVEDKSVAVGHANDGKARRIETCVRW
jgi:hypothetical protein